MSNLICPEIVRIQLRINSNCSLVFVLFLFFCFGTIAKGQSQHDTLKSSDQDSLHQHMEYLNELSLEFLTKDPEQTKQYAQKALTLALKNKNLYFEGRAYTNIGHYYDLKADYLQSLQYHLKALEIARSLKNKKEESRCLYNLGNIYSRIGNFESAFDHIYQALNGDLSAGDSAGILDDYNVIGQLHWMVGNNLRASTFFRKALKVAIAIGDTSSLVYLYTNIALVFQEEKVFDSAEYYHQLAIEYAQLIQSYEDEKAILLNSANLYLETGNLEKASQALETAKSISFNSNEIEGLTYLVEVGFFMKKGNWNESFSFALKYYNQSLAIKSKPNTYNSLLLLSEILEELKNYEKAHQYLKLALVYKDSLINQSNIQKFEAWDYNYKLRAKEAKQLNLEMSLLQKEKSIENQKYWITVSAALIFILGIIVFYDQRVQRQQKLHAKDIESRNKMLQDSLKKLTVLKDEMQSIMYHTAHDLKSPLNTIQGVLYLLKMKYSFDVDDQRILIGAESALHHGQDFIQQILAMHQDENSEVKSEVIELPAFLEEKLFSFSTQAKAKNIQINVKPSEAIFLTTGSYLLSRVLDNLISNALKFSLPGTSITLEAFQSSHEISISIQDQGQGFSEDDLKKVFQKFQKLSARATGGEKSHGLGLSSVKAIMEKLGGYVEIQSKLGEGSTFFLRFPIAGKHNT